MTTISGDLGLRAQGPGLRASAAPPPRSSRPAPAPADLRKSRRGRASVESGLVVIGAGLKLSALGSRLSGLGHKMRDRHRARTCAGAMGTSNLGPGSATRDRPAAAV